MGRHGEKARLKRLVWLGHLARMTDYRMPKNVLFSLLSEPRPKCGPKKWWRDVICKDLDYIGVNEDKWYKEATRSRARWRALCRNGVAIHQDKI